MASYTDVANLALQKIGSDDTIVAPDEDSHAARTVAAVWNTVRQACIRGGDKAPKWNFALRHAELPARAITPAKPLPYGWTAAFPFPDKCLRLVEVAAPCGSWLRYKVMGQELCASAPGPLQVWYLVDVEETALWDALFIETFAARLGYQVADRITGDRGRKKDCLAEYEANLRMAAAVDAREDPPVDPIEDDWVLARLGGDPGAGWVDNVRWVNP